MISLKSLSSFLISSVLQAVRVSTFIWIFVFNRNTNTVNIKNAVIICKEMPWYFFCKMTPRKQILQVIKKISFITLAFLMS